MLNNDCTRRILIITNLLFVVLNLYSNNPSDTVKAPGEIPLNDILSEYLQAGKTYGQGLLRHTVSDKSSWEKKRLSILNRSETMLGKPPVFRIDPLTPRVIAQEQKDGYEEQKVEFLSYTGDTIKGYLLVPEGISTQSPRPAILAMHSTGPGAAQTVGITPKENRSYGMELVQRGYVVLAIDVLCAGERVYKGDRPYYTDRFYNQFPEWSAMGKNIVDHQRGLDYLCSLDFVDPERLGCIGHSLGGYNSFFLLAFDPRVKAAVSSCGFSPMGKSNSPYQFARDAWYIHFHPDCRNFIRAGMIPCDMHEFMALCAPRPLFNYSATDDAIYYPGLAREGEDFSPWWETADKALSQVSRVYQILGAESSFVRISSSGGHDFPPEIREKAYIWLDGILGM